MARGWRAVWRPDPRWADSFEYDLMDHHRAHQTVRLTPRFEFPMRGVGYGHLAFGHKFWKGESLTTGERGDLPIHDALTGDGIHVQALCSEVNRLVYAEDSMAIAWMPSEKAHRRRTTYRDP